MLNEVLVSQAVLNGVRFIAAATVIAFVLLVSGVWGLGVRRSTSPGSRAYKALSFLVKTAIGLGLVVGVGVVALLGVSFWNSVARPRHWDLDLSARPSLRPFHTEKCAEWKIGDTVHVDCIFEGKITVSAKFPRGQQFQGSGHALWASGVGDEMESLSLFLHAMEPAEFETTLLPLFAAWGIAPREFHEWKKNTVAGAEKRASYFSPPEGKRVSPWLEISTRRSDTLPPEGRSWTATLKWHWKP